MNMTMEYAALVALACWFGTVGHRARAADAPIHLQSGPAQVQLLELFSSEGCSSCPPAERWVSDMRTRPELWKSVVPVVFHVDYWDGLGWKDRFASAAFTARQREYARSWGSDSVYTPGFVVNGAEWKGWFHGQALPASTSTSAGRLEAVSTNQIDWALSFSPGQGGHNGPVEFNVALLGFGRQSDVQAGENRGRKLAHDFVALDYVHVSASRNGEIFEAQARLKRQAETAPDAKLALAVWVGTADRPQVLQAVGGWFNGN